MIIRTMLVFGVLIVGAAWALLVPFGQPAFQAVPTSEIASYRDDGLLPAPGALIESEDLGHEIFEVPAEDEAMLEAAEALAGQTGMAGMPGMAPSGEMTGEMAAAGEMPGMPGMGTEGEHESAEAEGHGGMESEEHQGGAGLLVLDDSVPVDRVIDLDMREWGFGPGNIEVKMGQTIRLVVRNKGQIPHEFMFMTMTAMQAINYRVERADWNLLEHEALLEKPLIMPGETYDVVLRVQQPGMWMFMCMFPYHMQFGMMGAMATEGMSMGGMRM